MSTLEATPLVGNYLETVYMLRVYDTTAPGYTALVNRVEAKRIPAYLGTADAAVTAFEAAKTQAAKDTANAAITAATNQGATSAQTTPLTNRVNAVVISTNKEARISMSAGGVATPWYAAGAAHTAVIGSTFPFTRIANIKAIDGTDTGWSFILNQPATQSPTTGGASTGSNSGWAPDDVLAGSWQMAANGRLETEIRGLDPNKRYDFSYIASAVTGGAIRPNVCMTNNPTSGTDGGTQIGPLDPLNNTANVVSRTNIAPIELGGAGSGIWGIRLRWANTGSGNSPITGMILKEHDA